MVVLALIIITLFLLGIAVFFIVSLDAILRGHDLPTSPEAVKAVSELIREHKPDAHMVYDLGSGRGTFSLRLKAVAPALQIVGADKGPVRVVVARLKAHFLKCSVTFRRADIFKTDLRDADVIYTYLWYSVMPPLERHLRDALKPGTIVITNTSYFPTWQPITTRQVWPQHKDFERLFIYKV